MEAKINGNSIELITHGNGLDRKIYRSRDASFLSSITPGMLVEKATVITSLVTVLQQLRLHIMS